MRELMWVLLAGAMAAVAPMAQQDLQVRGRVVDEHGAPIAAARLGVRPRREIHLAAVAADDDVTTGEDGTFRLRLPRARAGDTEWWMPFATAPGRASAVVAPFALFFRVGTRDVDVGDLVLGPGFSLRGRVVGPDGEGVAGAVVTAVPASTGGVVPEWQGLSLQNPWCSVATAADGSFALHGMAERSGRLTVQAEGFFDRELAMVSAAEPVRVPLEASGFVRGRARFLEGRAPKHAAIHVLYARCDTDGPYPLDDAGRFAIPLRHPGAYRLQLTTSIAFAFGSGHLSERYDRPVDGVEIAGSAATGARGAITVRIVDADTGRAIERVRAAALWVPPELAQQPDLMRHYFAMAAIDRRVPGELQLPGPKEGEPDLGLILVEAPGYAPVEKTEVEWSDDSPPRLEVKMVPESVITGRVVDGEGSPIADAMVRRVDPADEQDPWWSLAVGVDRPGQGETDTDGRFRIGGLGAGTHRLRVIAAGRPLGTARVEVAARGKADVEIALAAGASLAGTIRGVEVGGGWRLLLEAEGDERAHNDPALELTWPTTRVAIDGRFRFTGLTADAYRLRLHVPHRAGAGGRLDIALGSVRVRGDRAGLALDLGDRAPGTIRGRVVLRGANVPSERLAVVSYPAQDPRRSSRPDDPEVIEPVHADGTFALPATVGRHQLTLIDLATRVTLGWVLTEVRPGAVTERELVAELVEVNVALPSSNPRRAHEAHRLEVITAPAAFQDAGHWLPDYDTGRGVALAPGQREVRLILPVAVVTLRVRGPDPLEFPDGYWHGSETVAQVELTPDRLTDDARIEIVVPSPELEKSR